MHDRNVFVSNWHLTLFNKIPVRILRSASLLMLAIALSACGLGNSDGSSGPVLSDQQVAFVKRPLLFDEDEEDELLSDDLRIPQSFRPGARLYIKNNASPDAPAKDITSSLFDGPYDVRDLNVSPDGDKLVFAMRAPEIENEDPEFQPKWNLWVYNFNTGRVSKLMSDNTAEGGHDITPAFLPDGRIVFASTRQQTSKAILLDEGKTQYAATEEDRLNDLEGDRYVESFVLHVVDADGTNIEQITFNQSHDLNPVVMDNGKIVFSRWDNAGQTRDNGINLYQVNPDGTGLSYLYGRHSHDTGDDDPVHFSSPLEAPDGNIIVQLREFESQIYSGQPTKIMIDDYIEADQQTNQVSGSGQSAVISGINTSGEPDLDGSYGSIFPLYDGTGRYLASWSICRIRETMDDPDAINTNPVEVCTQEKINSGDYESAPPLYGLWIVNGDTQLPIELPEEGQMFDEAVVVVERASPTYIEPVALDTDAQALADAGFGSLHIRSVYDIDGVDTSVSGITTLADPVLTDPADRPARFVRIEKPVSIPSEFVYDFDQGVAFGRSRAQSMREILGYAPVEPDGSVKIAVPANVAFAISILDEDGRRISQRHQNWLSVRPGENMECKGCHTADSEVPHGRPDAGPDSINAGALDTGQPFPNTDPALFADFGETMAEVYTRVNGVRSLSPDIEYEDEWADEDVIAKADPFDYSYEDLDSNSPISPDSACLTVWSSLCRLTINYPEHIHPIWGVDRSLEDDGVTPRIVDQTCTSCHNNEDDMGDAMVPVGDRQIDLSGGSSDQQAAHLKSYRELLFNDNEQEVVDGILLDRLVDTGEFEVDEDGELILDGEGNPIPIFATVNIPAMLNVNGANNNAAFFALFEGGSHDGYLSGAELKLISEWLDIGAQYWNDPFLAPED
ncbi:MAG: hypothetical protein C9356_07905 [Oleiphilus sp.]|nr:MAG: hypothetical protein C9356_07905 [Oleiphilus sp.]